MKGCRGDPAVLEKAVWSAIHARRADSRIEPQAPAEKPQPDDTAARLLAEAARLRALAEELLAKARELEKLAKTRSGR